MLQTKYKLDITARSVLEFWFDEQNKTKWFASSMSFDEEIRKKFQLIYDMALKGAYDSWADFPEETLALIIIFDQFSRNIYRGKSKSFATDVEALEALELSKFAIEVKYDHKLPNKDQRQFLYMPLMHSENPKDQSLSVEKFANIGKEAYEFALRHKEIIDKFGRFPHRNEALDRKSRPEEIDFLKTFKTF